MTKAKAQNSGQNLDELGGGYTGSSLRFFTFIFFSFLLGTRVAKPKKFFKNMNKNSNTQIEVSLSDEKKYAIANVTIYD